MVDQPFLPADPSIGLEAPSEGDHVDFFYNNKALYAAMARDIAAAGGPDDFVYLANWWCDVDVPLGDPNARPAPVSLRDLLQRASAERLAAGPASRLQPGAQVCAMFWKQKSQASFKEWSFWSPLLAAINAKAANHINALPSDSYAFLDGDHRLFGSHHQKILLVRKGATLVAYVGSTDFNADRVFPKGGRAVNPPTGDGAPLEDVHCRIEGWAADTVLRTYASRWSRHSEGQSQPLKGQGFTSQPVSRGTASLQITHTYGKGYPFKNPVASATRNFLSLIRQAKRYIYVEDQYLIGTPEIAAALRDRLNSQIDLHFIAVMSPMDISDLPYRHIACNVFWSPLAGGAFLDRVRIFEMTNTQKQTNGDGSYLHAKLMIFDDEVVTVGSANFSNRSMTHDSEIVATVAGATEDDREPKTQAGRVRLSRWSRHLGVREKDILRIPDALAKWKTLPSSALVKPWIPNPTVRWPSRDSKLLFENVIDPR